MYPGTSSHKETEENRNLPDADTAFQETLRKLITRNNAENWKKFIVLDVKKHEATHKVSIFLVLLGMPV